MLRSVRPLAAATLLAGPTALAFFSGGFFERPRLIAAIAAWCLAGVAALVSPQPLPRSASGRAALAALALLTAWSAVSYGWAPLGERAQGDIQRLLLYLGFFAAALALLRGAFIRAVEPGVAAGALAVTLYGLSDRLLPSLVELDRSRSAEGRLEQPLTYWNAMGCLSALGLILCVRLAGDAGRPGGVRAAAAAGAVPLAAGTYLSFSRGALFALASGLVLLVLLAPHRGAQRRAAALLISAGALASLAGALLPAVESLPPGERGDPAQGAAMLAAMVVLAAVAALVTLRRPPPAPDPGRRARMLTPATVAALGAVLVLGGLVGATAIERTSARPAGEATGVARLGSADTVRYEYWRVALDAFAADPLKGTGAGGFAVEWRQQPDRAEDAVDAHSLYVETLAELGAVGATLLAGLVAALAFAAVAARRRDPVASAGPAAALFAYALRAALDWDWEMPALTLTALLLAAALVTTGERPASAPSARSA